MARRDSMRIRPAAAPQQGMALVIALLLLLIMTLLGVTALSSSIMQGLMSSSFQQQNTVLADAENLLLFGEQDVEQLVVTGVDGRAYYINLEADPLAEFAAEQLATVWPGGSDFVIEYMGSFQVPGESVTVGGGFEDSILHLFRVTARERRDDGERGGLRIVQSLYVTLAGPDA